MEKGCVCVCERVQATEVIHACAHTYVCTYAHAYLYLYNRCHYAGWSTYCVLIFELLAAKWHHKHEGKFM